MDTSVAVQFYTQSPAVCRLIKCVRQYASAIFLFAFLMITANNVLVAQMRKTDPNAERAAHKWSLAFRSLERALDKVCKL
jgi:hypothetical protein